MAGLKGIAREPRESARARRNSQNLGGQAEFLDQNGVLVLDGTGTLTLRLSSTGGLENSGGELQIALASDPGLEFDGNDLRVKVDPPVTRTASGVGLAFGTGLRNDGGTLKTDDTQIVHDDLDGFVADEHVDHSSVEIVAGAGLTGGGFITGNVTLDVDDTQIVHDDLDGFVADEHVDHSAVNVNAGTGLSGGGDLTASRTLDLDAAAAATIGGVLEAAAVADLGQTISSPPTQAEVQAISDKVDELLAAMRAAGQLAP